VELKEYKERLEIIGRMAEDFIREAEKTTLILVLGKSEGQ
jgi:hypothetical protein